MGVVAISKEASVQKVALNHHNFVSEFQAFAFDAFCCISVSSFTARLILIPKCILSCLHFQTKGNPICHFVS